MLPPLTSTVLIVGAGTAGLACALGLRSHRWRGGITLLDPGPDHAVLPRLHEAQWGIRTRLPLAAIAARLRCRWVPAAVPIEDGTLRAADADRSLIVAGERESFSFLVLAPGSDPQSAAPRGAFDLAALRRGRQLEPVAERWVVGGGASAVQFAAARALVERVHLVSAEERLLTGLPVAFGTHAARVLRSRGVRITLRRRLDEAPAGALWLTGVRPVAELAANRFGQLRIEGAPLARIFAAGDAARYEGEGVCDRSAQAAVAMGKQVATNIRRLAAGRWLLPYRHRPRGYVLHLPPDDGVAWVGRPDRIVTGRAAAALHHALALQYDAMTRGIDLFVQSG